MRLRTDLLHSWTLWWLHWLLIVVDYTSNPHRQPPQTNFQTNFQLGKPRVWDVSTRGSDFEFTQPGSVVFSKPFVHFVEALADAGAHALVSWFPKVVRPFVFELAHYYGYCLTPATRDNDLRDQVTIC